MIRKKVLSPLLIAAGLVTFPAWSAEPDTVIILPADAVAQDVTPDATLDGTDLEVTAPQASQEEVSVVTEGDASNGEYRARPQRPASNAANPLGSNSKVNPLEPSPG